MPTSFLVQIHAGPVLVPLALGAALVWLLALGHRRALTPARALTVLATVTYAAAVLALTMFPLQIALGGYGNAAPWWTQVNLVPIVTADAPGFALNVLMLVPLGLVLPFLGRVRSASGAALVGLAVSTSIELVQGLSDVLLSSGRTADVNDVLANVIGTVLGLLAGRTLLRLGGVRLTAFALPGSSADGAGPGLTAPAQDAPATPAYALRSGR